MYCTGGIALQSGRDLQWRVIVVLLKWVHDSVILAPSWRRLVPGMPYKAPAGPA